MLFTNQLQLRLVKPPRSIDMLNQHRPDRKSTRLNSSHPSISYAVFCLKKKPLTRAPPLAPPTNSGILLRPINSAFHVHTRPQGVSTWAHSSCNPSCQSTT